MCKDEQEYKFREQIQNALDEEAGKPEDEINIERIEMLVKLLDTYDDKEKLYSSDYDEFLEIFNRKNGVSLQSSKSKKKKRRRTYNKYLTFRLSYRWISIAVIIVLVMTVSNMAVKASTDKSILSWLSKARDSVVFELKNTSYKGWTVNNEETVQEIVSSLSQDDFEEMEIIDDKLEFNEIDWTNTMKLNYIPEGYEVESVQQVEFGGHDGILSIHYKSSDGGGYITYFIEQLSVDKDQNFSHTGVGTEYSRSIEYSDFIAYIFTGEENNEAFFAADGKMYSINTTLDEEALCEILENAAYEK